MRPVMEFFSGLSCAEIRIESMMKKLLSATSFLCVATLFLAGASAVRAAPQEGDKSVPSAVSTQTAAPHPAVNGGETIPSDPELPAAPPPTNLELGMAALAAKSYGDAVKYLNEAAKQGEAIAQFELGRLYSTGQGVKANLARAFDLLKSAADGGVEAADVMVADALRTGSGVKKDLAQAIARYRVAATRDDAGALAA